MLNRFWKHARIVRYVSLLFYTIHNFIFAWGREGTFSNQLSSIAIFNKILSFFLSWAIIKQN